MALPPITIQLSNFQQIEILRDQIEQFEEELKKTESRIRDVLYEVEKQRYLRTVHPIFQHGAVVAESQALPEMNGSREALAGALESMKATLANLEAVSGPVPPAAASPRQSQIGQRPIPTRSAGVPPPQAYPGGLSGAIGNPGQPNTPGHPSSPGIPSPLRRNRFDAF